MLWLGLRGRGTNSLGHRGWQGRGLAPPAGRNLGAHLFAGAHLAGARGACLPLMLRLRCDNGARTGTISPSPLNARPKCVPAPGMYQPLCVAPALAVRRRRTILAVIQRRPAALTDR